MEVRPVAKCMDADESNFIISPCLPQTLDKLGNPGSSANVISLLQAAVASFDHDSFDSTLILIESISKVVSVLSLKANSQQTMLIAKELEKAHLTINLWRVAKLFDSIPRLPVYERFISVYFSIPIKLCNILQAEGDADTLFVLNPTGFAKKIAQDFGSVMGFIKEASVPKTFRILFQKLYISGVLDCCIYQFCTDYEMVEKFLGCLSTQLIDKYFGILLGTVWLSSSGYPVLDSPVSTIYKAIIKTIMDTHSAGGTALLVKWIISGDISIQIVRYLIVVTIAGQESLFKEAFRQVLLLWKDVCLIKTSSAKHQQYIANLLLSLFGHVSKDEMNRYPDATSFLLEGITKRIDLVDLPIRILGMLVGEAYATLYHVDRPLDFELDQQDCHVKLAQECFRYGDILFHLSNPSAPYVEHKFLKMSTTELASSSADFDEYKGIVCAPGILASGLPDNIKLVDSLNNRSEPMPRNIKLKPPKYLKDCLEYMRTYQDDANKLELVFIHLPKIMSGASSLALDEMGVDLFRMILYLGTDYNMEAVQKNRSKYLCDLFLASPSTCSKFLVEQFNGRTASLLQKNEMLLTITNCLDFLSKLESRSETAGITGKASEANQSQRQYLFEQAFRVENFQPVLVPTKEEAQRKMHLLIKSLYFPLLTITPHYTCRTFKYSYNTVLDKYLCCLAMFLHTCKTASEYPNMIKVYLEFVLPLLECDLRDREFMNSQLLQSLLAGLYIIVVFWPDYMSSLEHMEALCRIGRFISSVFEAGMATGTDPDSLLTKLGISISAGIERLLNNERIIAESVKLLELDINEQTGAKIKCTRPKINM